MRGSTVWIPKGGAGAFDTSTTIIACMNLEARATNTGSLIQRTSLEPWVLGQAILSYSLEDLGALRTAST